jgi:hypothetical protein
VSSATTIAQAGVSVGQGDHRGDLGAIEARDPGQVVA